ncbi:MAG: hypothetical protein K5660_03920 [Paludibacteraceae bacterium]|nr:hypothetical protein [Paludibacteraceae bacterium]
MKMYQKPSTDVLEMAGERLMDAEFNFSGGGHDALLGAPGKVEATYTPQAPQTR